MYTYFYAGSNALSQQRFCPRSLSNVYTGWLLRDCAKDVTLTICQWFTFSYLFYFFINDWKFSKQSRTYNNFHLNIFFPLPMCGTYSRWRDISLRSQGFEEIDLRSVTLVWLHNAKFLLILKKKYTEMLIFSTIKMNINFYMFRTQFLVKKDYFWRLLDFNFFLAKLVYENELKLAILCVLIKDSGWGILRPASSYSLIKTNLLILSLHLHTKLNITEFMLLIISLSKEIREARYINLGIANVLTNWILPVSVKFLHWQQLKDVFTDFKVKSKLSSILLCWS